MTADDLTVERSKRGKRARNRGHGTERMVARWLRANGYPDAETTRAKLGHSGTRQPGDISFHPLVVLEVKAVEKKRDVRWPSWCRQAVAESSPGQVPVVLWRTPGVADVGAWECRVQWFGWWKATSMPLFRALRPSRTRGHGDPSDLVRVDDDAWAAITFAEFVAVLRRFDTLDGA